MLTEELDNKGFWKKKKGTVCILNCHCDLYFYGMKIIGIM